MFIGPNYVMSRRSVLPLGLQSGPDVDLTRDYAGDACKREMAALVPEKREAELYKTIKQTSIVQAVGATLLAIGAGIVAYQVKMDIEPTKLMELGTIALLAAGGIPAMLATQSKSAAKEFLAENFSPEVRAPTDIAKSISAMREKSFGNNKENKLTI